METHEEHTVTFYSPGTMVAETTTRDIPEAHPQLAARMAREIEERHGATPYGFQFHTYERPDPIEGHEFKRKLKDTSGLYYLDCKVETLAEVKARGDEREKTLISNMECNGWDRIVTTTKGWKWTQPLRDGDKVVNAEGEVVFPKGE